MKRSIPLICAKFHEERCVVHNIARDFHVGKSNRKKANKYKLTVNTEYKKVVEEIWKQHGHNWLFPPLAE